MRIVFAGHQTTVTEALKAAATEKLQKIEPMTHHEGSAVHVTFDVDQSQHTAKFRLNLPGHHELFASHTCMDMYQALDEGIKKLRRQLVDLKSQAEASPRPR